MRLATLVSAVFGLAVMMFGANFAVEGIVSPAQAQGVSNRERDIEEKLRKAETMIREENYESAIVALDSVISSRVLRGFNLGVAHFQRGMAYYRMDKCAEAMPDYGIAVELMPEDPNPVSARGFCHLTLGNSDAALADFITTTQLDEKNLSALSNICVIHYNAKRYAEAVAFCIKAAEAAPDNAALAEAKAAALELSGDKAGALVAWQALLVLASDNKNAKDGVARTSQP